MGYNPDKFTRISVDLTQEEYNDLHRTTSNQCATKSAFVRKAIRELIEEMEEQQHLRDGGRKAPVK